MMPVKMPISRPPNICICATAPSIIVALYALARFCFLKDEENATAFKEVFGIVPPDLDGGYGE
jgi:hypothetical protein